MATQLALDLYKWLVVMKCLPNDSKLNDKGKVQLTNNSASQLQNGLTIGKLIKAIIRSLNQSSPSSLDHLKDQSSANAKNSNWNMIWSCFPLIRMDFDPQIKELIVAGDTEMVSEVIKQLYEKYPADISKVEVQSLPKVIDKAADKKSVVAPGDAKAKQQSKDVVDMTKLDQKKDPDSADSSLEFLLLLLCQSLKLPANQVLGLFTNQNKYLAHLIAKGLKGDFTPIISFYQALKNHVPKMKNLFQSDPKSEGFTLYALKPGLVSKNPQVVQLTIDLFKEFDMYDWFIGEGKCLLTLILGVKRHPKLNYSFVDLLIKVTESNFAEFITNIYKAQFENVEEFMSITGELLKPLSESDVSDKLDKSGAVFEWLSTAMQNLQVDGPKTLPTRIACLQFINKLWVAMPEYIEDDEETYGKLIMSLKKDWLTRTFEQFLGITIEMFSLLVALANEKNPSAKLIYNELAVVLSQTLNSDDHRSFLLANFTRIFKQFPNMPLGELVQNYSQVAQMQIFDFDFLTNIASAPNLDGKSANIIGQIASTFFQQTVVNGCCSAIIIKVVSRFPKDMIEFVGKTVKSLMATLYALEKNKKVSIDKPMPLYNGRRAVPSSTPTPSNEELEAEVIAAQKRSLIIELIKKISIQNNEQINEKIKPYIVATSLQIKQFNKQGYKGINALLTLFGNPRDMQKQHLEEVRQRRASESTRYANQEASNRPRVNIRVTAPDSVLKDLEKLHSSVMDKHKRQQKQAEIKILEEQRKKILVKKQMEKVKFMKGFGGGQAQLFQDGYWEKKLDKKPDGIEVVELDLLEPRDLEFIDIILKKYHKVMRQLFLKYTTTGFTTKKELYFDQQAQRSETISNTQLVKMLKQYKLFFLTDLVEIQQLTRDLNVKILKKRETQQLDFSGFEQYIIQFALVIFSRPHTVNIKTEGRVVSQKRELKNMMPAQILETFFKYLRTVTEERGQNTVLFDDPDTAYFNESEVIKQFNSKLEQDPNYILPEGYKKVTDKTMTFQAKIKGKVSQGIKQSYVDCYQILDEITFNGLGFHLLELIAIKNSKCKARPNVFVNIGSKLMEGTQKFIPATERSSIENANRLRDMIASAGNPKPQYPVQKLLQKKTLSLGMKIGLSRVPYKYKLLGEQVAYVLDDMLSAVEGGRTTIEKPKIINDVLKSKQKMEEQEKRIEELRKKKLQDRKKELDQIKKELIEKKQKDPKEAEQKLKKKKEQQKEKKKKQEMDKYLTEQKAKLEAKKKQQQESVKKQLLQDKQKKKKQQQDKKKKFDQFNQKQIQKFKSQLKTKAEQEEQKKKKQQTEQKLKQQKLKKLRERIHVDDNKINTTKHKIIQQLNELYNSPGVQQVFKKHEFVLKTLYNLLIKSTFTSVGGRRHNNEIILETWLFFNFAFKLTPVILDAKQVTYIFQSLTRMKHQTIEFFAGMDYEQFKQALLREAVKHKTVFNKIAAKIKDGKLDNADVSEVLKAEDKNEFQQPKEMDLNTLLKQEVSNPKILDDYGDISKADQNTIRGLIFYLKLPEDKKLLQMRFRQVLQEKNKRSKTNKQELKEKLNDDYSIITKSPKPRAKRSKSTVNQQGGKQQQKQIEPQPENVFQSAEES